MQRDNILSIVGLFTSLTLIGSACGGSQLTDPGPGKRVQATIEQQIYYSGDMVIATITNVSSVTLTFPVGFCKTDLQRFQGATGTWITAATPSDGCPLALGILEPGKSTVLHYPLPSGTVTGLYRLAMPMPVPRNASAPEPELLTPQFEVNPVALNQ
jgi:hypothetical protein